MDNIDCGKSSAYFSECNQYRYWLTRAVDDLFASKPPIAFIMLNPSKADSKFNDPTIRRCINFSTSWGHKGLVVANLYAYKSTQPKILFSADDPVGKANDYWLTVILASFQKVVCGWGEHADSKRVKQFLKLAKGIQLWCLQKNKSGMPKHPLYVRADKPLIPWDY